MQRYTELGELGKGTYGKVIKAVDKETGKIVAIKQIGILDKVKEGVHVTALREIKILKELHHPNVLNLIQVLYHKGAMHLVCEYMVSDLEVVIKDRSHCALSPADVKAYLTMTLQAVAHCHKHWVLHRDLKPNNLLIAKDGSIQLADFGLSRIFGSPERQWTNQVYQLWYRAPELLMGCTEYSEKPDMWAVGCIFAELILRRPYFQGRSELDQLSKIFTALGTPSEEQWQGMKCLPSFLEFQTCTAPDPSSVFPPGTSEDALHLLSKLLSFDPNARPSADEALKHRYFRSSPSPTPIHLLPLPPSASAASTDKKSPSKPHATRSPQNISSTRSPLSANHPSHSGGSIVVGQASNIKRKFETMEVDTSTDNVL